MNRSEILLFALALTGAALLGLAAFQFNTYYVTQAQAKATIDLLSQSGAADATQMAQTAQLAADIAGAALNAGLADLVVGILLILGAYFWTPAGQGKHSGL